MVASTVANGPSSPWDAISLFISLRIWRVKRIIDAYVLPVKVEMEIVVRQYEKAKLIQEEQLDRLTQMCQEQAFEIRQLRAHLAQQDLDLVAERERALKLPHELQSKIDRFKVVAGRDSDEEATENLTELSHEVIMKDDMNNYITQYYNEASSESGVPGTCIITTAAIDVHHHPNISSDLYSAEVAFNPGPASNSSSVTSVSVSRSPESSETLAQSISSQVFCSSTDCSTREESTEYCPLAETIRNRVNKTVVQELLSSLSDDSSFIQKGLDPANLHLSNPVGLRTGSPRHGLNIYNRVNRESFGVFHDRAVIPLNLPLLESKPIETKLK
ncbi:hypothetical protein GDO78_005572 [Eleutherodactylus coqui]|nr:hypothetical protein GDO78_005572 [Eleutherodactylus coqui]